MGAGAVIGKVVGAVASKVVSGAGAQAATKATAGVATSVTKTADHVLPIGPSSEKTWTVLNQIDGKGAPLPGYKGGSVFKNAQGKLPEGVTYHEWDVNQHTKGVNREAERIVTGGDGSAYLTGDHYGTFLMYRGPTG